MYKVFLVEDEIIAREGIRDGINWKNTEFEFVGEAPDGELALPEIKKIEPDILLTDIKMPFMDGLELSKIVKKILPDTKIIILSGHDDCDFAKKAIEIGITEYLLKPVTSTEIMSTLEKTARIIERDKKEKQKLDFLENKFQENKQILKEKFLLKLILGKVDTIDVIDGAEKYNIDILSKYFMVINISYKIRECDENVYYDYVDIDDFISKIIADKKSVFKIKKSIDNILLIVKANKKGELETLSENISREILEKVKSNKNTDISIGIGGIKDRINDIYLSQKESEDAINTNNTISNENIIKFVEIDEENHTIEELEKYNKIRIGEFIRTGNQEGVDDFVKKIINVICGSKTKKIITIKYFYLRIIIKSFKFLQEMESEKSIIIELNKYKTFLSSITTTNDFDRYLKEILYMVIQERDMKPASRNKILIEKAKKYIEINYCNENMSLQNVADYIDISQNYFSSLFKNECGLTFIEFIINNRIDKAKKLLKTTSKKIYQISEEIGYSDSHYFSYLFRKNVGVSPKEYRAKFENGN